MARRLIVKGESWEVAPSGRLNVYGRDQFAIVFQLGTGPQRKQRVTRYSPIGHRSPERALAELTDARLQDLFRQSQPAWTAPEAAYGAR